MSHLRERLPSNKLLKLVSNHLLFPLHTTNPPIQRKRDLGWDTLSIMGDCHINIIFQSTVPLSSLLPPSISRIVLLEINLKVLSISFSLDSTVSVGNASKSVLCCADKTPAQRDRTPLQCNIPSAIQAVSWIVSHDRTPITKPIETVLWFR